MIQFSGRAKEGKKTRVQCQCKARNKFLAAIEGRAAKKQHTTAALTMTTTTIRVFAALLPGQNDGSSFLINVLRFYISRLSCFTFFRLFFGLLRRQRTSKPARGARGG
jgi:hypothetical protein